MRASVKLRAISQLGEKLTSIIDDGHAHKVQFGVNWQVSQTVVPMLFPSGVCKRVSSISLSEYSRGPRRTKLISPSVLVDRCIRIRLRC